MSSYFKLYLFILSLVVSSVLHSPYAQNNMDKGWNALANNDFELARQASNAELSGPSAGIANLALSLVDAAESKGNHERSFQHYANFYNSGGENIQHYIQGLWSFSYERRTEAELEFLEKIAEQETGTLQAYAFQYLGYHHYLSKNLKKAANYFNRIGAVQAWSVLGEFENVSESGFDKDFQALAHPEAEYVFTNKRGVNVKWFDIKAPRFDNWVDMDYFFYSRDAIIYAQNFCESPRDQEVQFRLGVSGSVKVWVNDQLLFSEAQERNNELDSYVFTAKLLKGYNRILVQLGESETDNCNFLLRVTDTDGKLIPDLTFTTERHNYNRSYAYKSKRVPDPTISFFEQKLSAEPRQLADYLVLQQYLLHNDQLSLAKRYLQKSTNQFPDCTYLLSQQLRAYAQDDNRTLTKTLVETIKAKDPDGSLALNQSYDEARERDDLEEQEAILKQIAAGEGRTPNVVKKELLLAIDKDEREQMIQLIEEGYKRFPTKYLFVGYKLALEKDINGSPRDAIKVLKRYLNNHFSEDAIIELASLYFKQGLIREGIETYEKLIEYNPIATGYYSRLASFAFNTGQYGLAEKYVKECIRIAPYLGSYYVTLANTYSEIDEKEYAIEAYDMAVYLNPYDYDSRRQLRILREEGDIFDQFPEEDVLARYQAAPTADEFPDDHSIILLHDIQKVAYPGGGAEQRQMILIKTFNSEGVDAWKEYNIPVYDNQKGQVEKAETLKADGSRIEAEQNGGHLVFSNLEPGDAIHVSYRLQDYFTGRLARHFWGKHYFASYLPQQHTRLSILVPKDANFQHVCANGQLQPQVKARGDFKQYTWESKDMEAIDYEPYMSSLVDVAPIVHYTSFPDWNFISDWYNDLAKAKAKVNFEVEEVAENIFAGQTVSTERDKAERIYEYIVNNIRYRSVSFLQSGLVPQKASTTLSAKQGDCKDVSTLFVALCQTQGIDADLMLVNTRDNGRQAMELPSINFNHCIAHVELDGKPYYLELTSENLPFATATRYSTLRSFALHVQPSTEGANIQPTLLDNAALLPTHIVREVEVYLEGDGMTVSLHNIKSGSAASSMRNTYEKIGSEQQFKNMQEAINSSYVGIKLLDVNFPEGLDDNGPDVVYDYTYEVPDVFTDISNLRIFDLPITGRLENPDFLSTDERTYPIELWEYFYYRQELETLTVHIPEDYSSMDLPAPTEIENDYFRYSLVFKLGEGHTVVVERRFELLEDIVQPADYPDFKLAMQKMIKADEGKMSISPEG